MKVLVADKFEQSGLDGIAALGCELVSMPNLAGDTLREAIATEKPQVLVVRSTKVTFDMLEGSTLGLIIRAGAGVNTIDVAGASGLGIMVANCPGKNAQAVAELAFGLMIACDRHIPDNVQELREGKWNKKSFSKAKGLYGRTLGLVGMGKIGQEMAIRARAFGMNVLVFSRWMTPEVAAHLGVGRASSLHELASSSDFVSVHVSYTPETKQLINADFFQAMPAGSVFINTSRCETVDQAALKAAVESGHVTAGLDVFDGEPSGGDGEFSGEVKSYPNTYCTHHIGASTDQAQEAVADETVRIIREYKLTGVAPNVVNVQSDGVASHLLVVRHLDRVGVLAHVLTVLKDAGANVQEMENIVLGGAKAAIAQIGLDKHIGDASIALIKSNVNVLDVSQSAI